MRVKVVQEPGPAFGKLTVYGEEVRDKVKGSQPQEERVKDITWEAETRCHGSPGRKDRSEWKPADDTAGESSGRVRAASIVNGSLPSKGSPLQVNVCHKLCLPRGGAFSPSLVMARAKGSAGVWKGSWRPRQEKHEAWGQVAQNSREDTECTARGS